MMIGYGRVSTADQNPELQIDALKAAGCQELYIEKKSGKTDERPKLQEMLSKLRPGDTLVVWKLSRLGRSQVDLVKILKNLQERSIEFKCIQMNLDTSTPTGRLFMAIIMAFDEFERENIVENTRAGLEAAKARGRTGGRPKGLEERYRKIAHLLLQAQDNGATIREIKDTFSIKSTSTTYKIIKYARDQRDRREQDKTKGQ